MMQRLLLGFCVVALLIYLVGSRETPPPAPMKATIPLTKIETVAEIPAPTPAYPAPLTETEKRQQAILSMIDHVRLTSLSWHKDGFGSVAIISVTVQNDNSFAVKDIVLACDFRAKSGTKLQSKEHTIYDVVKARSKRSFPDVNTGFIHSQSANIGCSVGSVTPIG
jgi:hypothetical protein